MKPFHVVWDFRPSDVMTKVRYFLMVQIHNLRTLEVELSLNMIWSLVKDLDLPELTLITLLRVPIYRPNRQCKARIAKMA